jgi:hypothetical protein
VRAFHGEILGIARNIRNTVVSISDESLSKWIINQGMIRSSKILPESLANQVRNIYPYFRLSSTFLEELWFKDGFAGKFQSCFACPANGIQSELSCIKLLGDGFFSANRFLSSARQLRSIHPGYKGSLLLDPRDVIDFGKEFGKLPSDTCGQHKSNNGKSSVTKSHKDQTGLLGIVCGHGMMLTSLFMTTGERFHYLAQLLTKHLDQNPWLVNVILSYDIGCKFKPYFVVYSFIYLN